MTDQQKEAITSKVSCVVAAGAGSGKTLVLSERFVYLIKQGLANCDQILTITFTKKATTEMKDRIHKALLDNNLTEQLKLFPNAWISTVDSFCAEVARTDCYSYEFSSNFAMLDEDEFELQAQRIALRTLEEFKDKKFISKLLSKTTVDTLLAMMINLAKEFNVVKTFDPLKESDFVLGKISNVLEVNIESLREQISDFYELTKDYSQFDSTNEMLSKLSEEPEKLASQIVFSKANGGNEIKDEVKRIKTQVLDLCNKISSLSSAKQDQDFVKQFYNLVSNFENKISEFKRNTNSLNFADVMQIAIDILTNNKSIRRRFKELFKYVMIDEFQDNNDDYRKILFLLCEKYGKEGDGIPSAENLESTKIFLVGDEKQSIYRFRGADVSVFKNMSEQIEKSGGKHIELGNNFRTEPALVNFFNKAFARVMRDSTYDFEASFKDIGTREPRPIKSRIIYHNYVHPYSGNPTEDEQGNLLCSPSQAEAYHIAKLIKEMVETDCCLVCKKDDEPHRPKYNEIAILLRSLSHQGDFEKALRLEGIPYSVAQPRATFQEAVINDFYSLLNLAIYPYDNVSKIAVENSPFGGKESAEELAQKVREVLAKGSIANTLDYIYYNLSYREYLVSNPANQVYSEHYDWLFSLAQQYDNNNWDVVKFLDYIRPLLGTQDKSREVTVLREENLGVQIMTIHKSKGLEFPIVFVASMDSAPHAGGDKIEFSFEDNKLYLPVITDSSDRLKNLLEIIDSSEEERKEEAELKRLFYVAATRAENHLIFSGQYKVTKSAKEKTTFKTISDMFIDATGFNPETCQFENNDFSTIELIEYKPVSVELTLSKQKLDSNSIQDKASWYENCNEDLFDFSKQVVGVTTLIEEERSNTVAAKEQLKKIDCDPFIRTQELRTAFGTMVHSLIESAVTGNEPEIKPCKELTDEQNQIMQNDAKKLANGFIESNLFAEIKQKYQKLYSELRFQLYDKNIDKTIEGSMDLVCENESSVLVIDFKTDSVKCPEEHKAQLAWYEKAAQSLFESKAITTQVVYLRENN